MARPRKALDPEQIWRLAGIGCTVEEIAHVMACSPDTLTRRFADRIEKGRAEGRASLRRKQWATAMGDTRSAATMQIWLGKQLLGQKDRSAVDVAVSGLDAILNDLDRQPDDPG